MKQKDHLGDSGKNDENLNKNGGNKALIQVEKEMDTRWSVGRNSRTWQIGWIKNFPQASQVAQKVQDLPAMWETWVQSLGWEDPLGKGMPTTPVFLPGEFHGQKSLVGYSPWDCKELDRNE